MANRFKSITNSMIRANTFQKVIISMILAFSLQMNGLLMANELVKPILIFIDGVQQSYQQPPIVENGRTLVPLRGIFETLGAEVTWAQATQSVFATKDNISIKLTLGKTEAFINGVKINLDVPAKAVNGNTLVPLRFVSEALAATVEWDSQSSKITIQTPELIGRIQEQEKWSNLKNKHTMTLITTTELTDLQIVSPKDSLDTITWYGYELNDINLFFTKSSLEIYIYLVDAANSINSEIKSYMGTELKHKINVFVADQYTNKNSIYTGSYVWKGDYLYLNGHPDPDYDLRTLFAHEMTHVFQYQHWNSNNLFQAFGAGPGSWIHEGMAEYVARQVATYPKISFPTGTLRQLYLEVKDYKESIKNFQQRESITTLESMVSWPKEWYSNDYIVYESIVFFLEKKYGQDKFINWIQLVSDGKSLPEATELAYGNTDEDLIKEWKDYFSIK
jgi:hypothetical protein